MAEAEKSPWQKLIEHAMDEGYRERIDRALDDPNDSPTGSAARLLAEIGITATEAQVSALRAAREPMRNVSSSFSEVKGVPVG